MAIEGITIPLVNSAKYFYFPIGGTKCQQYPINTALTCSDENINLNSCTRLTRDDYCYWDRANLKCNFVEDYSKITSCSSLINEKACYDLPDLACNFLYATDSCETVDFTDISCTHYDGIGTVSAKACAMITRDGNSCNYNPETHLC